MPPAARITDFHACPMVTPGTPPIPHVGGPIMKGSPNVLTGKLPQARVGDQAVCVGPMDVIVKGSSGVFVNKMAAARIGDQTAHGGSIVVGLPTVIIGETKGGGGGGAAGLPVGAVVLAYTEVIHQLQVLIEAWKSGAPFCEACFKKAMAASPFGGDEMNAAKFAMAGTTPATLPKKPAIATGLGPTIDKHLRCSPTLSSNVEKLQRDGWVIKYGEKDGGSYCQKDKKTIVVDPSTNELGVVQTLAHESGHALYKADPYVSPIGRTKDDYVSRNANANLKDEGEATLTNIEVRQEALTTCKEDIGIAGSQAKKYEAVADKYKIGAKPRSLADKVATGSADLLGLSSDRDKARQEIADLFAEGEHPSTEPSITYRTYYERAYRDQWDKIHPKK